MISVLSQESGQRSGIGQHLLLPGCLLTATCYPNVFESLVFITGAQGCFRERLENWKPTTRKM